MKVCILGNCQAQHLEMMLSVACPQAQVERLPPVFMLRNDEKDSIHSRLHGADVIFAQRISREYNIDWIASDEVRSEFGEKSFIWPNVYFDGYFPGVQYVYLPKWGKLLSPLGEYHFDQIRSAHTAGKTVDEAVEAFSGDRLFDSAPRPFDESLDQLRARETDVDTPISDVIADQASAQRLFYTPNHPVNGLLARMLGRLSEKAGLAIAIDKAEAAPYRLDELSIATSEAIVRRFSLPFDHAAVYRGREIVAVEPHTITLGEPRDYDARSLTEAFYRLYDAVGKHS